MPPLRVLIADDEPLARERVRMFLAGKPTIQVVFESGDGADALSELRSNPPDIAILDIRMPGLSGIEILRELPAERRPAVILATAHDRFAVDAFGVQVVDYLVKPFDQSRFDLALSRAVAQVASRRRVRSAGSDSNADPRQLEVSVDGDSVLVRAVEILWIEAANNYCLIHLFGPRRLLVRATLGSLQQKLGSGFVRINRSALVSVREIAELRPGKFGDYTVGLRCGASLPLSRKSLSAVKAL
ncbi:MAG TPA: LytTR family DNA-binding domain-containing protein [Opitutaceae bacterium]|jgi:two-component system LytT family response regulator